MVVPRSVHLIQTHLHRRDPLRYNISPLPSSVLRRSIISLIYLQGPIQVKIQWRG